MPKSLTFKAPCVAYGIGSILRGMVILWSEGSLWKGREWIWGLKNGIKTPLVKGLVSGKGFRILRFRGLSSFLLLLNLMSKHTNFNKGSVSL